MEYESAFLEKEENDYFNLSAHLLWIGYRTLKKDSAHIEFFRGIQNPIGIKIGPSIESDLFVEVVQTLNPFNSKGKLIIILRLGKNNVDKLKKLIMLKQ